MSGFPVTGVPGVPGGYATLSSTGSVLSAIPSGSTGLGVGSLAGPDTSGTATAVGYHALNANTAAAEYGNTAFGYMAGAANTTGGITAFGYKALASNTTAGGTGNVDEQSNSAFGMNALRLNTTGIQNTAVGGAALEQNTTGSANVAVGSMALEDNTTGSNNTAIGWGTLQQIGPGVVGNTAIGSQSLGSAPSGSGNTAVGLQSLAVCSSGGSNVALGASAGQALTTGNNNVLVGVGAGYVGDAPGNTVAGNDNTFVGLGAGPGNSSDPSHCTAIGCQASCIGNGSVAIGRDSAGNGAAATLANQIMLGTANHTVYIPGATNTSLGATYSNPTLTNSVVGAVINATKDTMLYLEVTTVFVLLVISMGPASTPTNAIFTAAACPVGTLITLRVPGGWYVATSYTSGAFHQATVTC